MKHMNTSKIWTHKVKKNLFQLSIARSIAIRNSRGRFTKLYGYCIHLGIILITFFSKLFIRRRLKSVEKCVGFSDYEEYDHLGRNAV
jgi:hypothetical protein